MPIWKNKMELNTRLEAVLFLNQGRGDRRTKLKTPEVVAIKQVFLERWAFLEEGATSAGCKDTASGLFPTDTAETPPSLHIPTRGSRPRVRSPGSSGEQRPGDSTLSSQLGPLGAPDTPASGRGGEERGRFLPGFLWEKQGKEEAVAQPGLGVRLREQRARTAEALQTRSNQHRG